MVNSLKSELGLGSFQNAFTVNNEGRSASFEIDWERIRQLIDDTGKEIYTFAIEDLDDDPLTFYNLVFKLSPEGEPYRPFVMKYTMAEEFYPQFVSSGSLRGYQGSVQRIFLANNQWNPGESTANMDGGEIMLDAPCPPQDVNPPAGGGGGSSNYDPPSGDYICTTYMEEYTWYTVVCDANGQNCSEPRATDTYFSIATECNWVSGSSSDSDSNCDPDNDEIPIIEPDLLLKRLRDLIECDPRALLNGNNENYDAWSDLAQHDVPPAAQDRLNSVSGFDLSLQNARGPIVNMDDFSVRVQSLPPGISAMDLFQALRGDINGFIDTSLSLFTPFSADDVSMWYSNNPVGSMFSIYFYDPVFGLNVDDGTVITTDYTGGTWIFTTAFTPKDLQHPVSGNREFGFMSNSDGSYTFFTRGVDRTTTQFDATAQYFTNMVFGGADKLWASFQRKLAEYVNAQGGQATIQEPIKHRVDWDLVENILLDNVELPECGG